MARARSLEIKEEDQDNEEEINSSICPVMGQVFNDPVVSARTGITLEREGAQQWHVEFKHNTCPVTRKETRFEDYVPNITFKNFIEEMRQKTELYKNQLAKIKALENENEQYKQELTHVQHELARANHKITQLKTSLGCQAELLASSMSKAREDNAKLRALEESAWQQMQSRFFNQKPPQGIKTVSIPDCEFLFAVHKKDVNKAKTWLNLGANILARDAKSNETAMDIAKKNNDKSMLEMLGAYRKDAYDHRVALNP